MEEESDFEVGAGDSSSDDERGNNCQAPDDLYLDTFVIDMDKILPFVPDEPFVPVKKYSQPVVSNVISSCKQFGNKWGMNYDGHDQLNYLFQQSKLEAFHQEFLVYPVAPALNKAREKNQKLAAKLKENKEKLDGKNKGKGPPGPRLLPVPTKDLKGGRLSTAGSVVSAKSIRSKAGVRAGSAQSLTVPKVSGSGTKPNFLSNISPPTDLSEKASRKSRKMTILHQSKSNGSRSPAQVKSPTIVVQPPTPPEELPPTTRCGKMCEACSQKKTSCSQALCLTKESFCEGAKRLCDKIAESEKCNCIIFFLVVITMLTISICIIVFPLLNIIGGDNEKKK